MMVVYFDGVCGLCNRVVQILIKLDRKKVLKFKMLQETDLPMNSILYKSGGLTLEKSDAVIQILMDLGGVYGAALIFKILPRFIRNFLYDTIANNRYRIWGKYDSCPIPSPEIKDRFI